MLQERDLGIGESGDHIRYELPLTEPFSKRLMLHYSSDDFCLEPPETVPFPTSPLASLETDPVQLKYSRSELLSPLDAEPLAVNRLGPNRLDPGPLLEQSALSALSQDALPADVVPVMDMTPPVEIAYQSDQFHTIPISAAKQKTLREQATRWQAVKNFEKQSQQSERESLEAGFKHDAAALRERYIIERVLAVGGTGIVYKARAASSDLHAPGTEVAIKTLRPEYRTNADAIQRLKREFHYTTALNHPNIVRHFGLDQKADTWFITMALLGGRTLASLLKEASAKPLSIEEALFILKACCEALWFAHSQGIVHCDLKPSNVWITDAREVFVIDFGAAQRCAASNRTLNAERLVTERELPRLITPAYASPQFLDGKPAEPRDDVYSLACIAYELLGHTNLAAAATIDAVQCGMHVQQSRRTANMHALYRNIETSLDHSVVATQVAAQMSTQTVASQQAPEALLSPALPSQSQIRLPTNIELQSGLVANRFVERHTNPKPLASPLTELNSCLISNQWLRSVRYPSSLPSQDIALIRHAPVFDEPKTLPVWQLFRRRTSTSTQDTLGASGRDSIAVGFVLSLVAFALFSRPGAVVVPLVSKVQATSVPARQIPVVANFIAANDSMIFGTVPEWNTLAMNRPLNRQGNSRWRVGVDLLPGAVVNQPATAKAATPKSKIGFDQQTVTVSDRALMAVLQLKRTGSLSEPASVQWRIVADTAKPGTDYQDAPSGSARFAENQSTRTLYVQLKNNEAPGNRKFAVELQTQSPNAALSEISRAEVTIQSSD